MLNRVEIRGLRRPHHDIKSMVCQPGFSLFTGVFRVIILLEDHLLRSFAPILKAILELILKDTNIEVGIHIAIDFAGIPHPLPPKAAPQHHMRSEEHTSELQSHSDLVCRLLLEKKKNTQTNTTCAR